MIRSQPANPSRVSFVFGSENIEYVPVTCPERLDSCQVVPSETDRPRLSANREYSLFLEMNLAKQRANELCDRLADRPDSHVVDEIQAQLRRAVRLRRYLVELFFPLAVSVARDFDAALDELDDLVGQATVTLIRAVERFDVERGFRFSTYATRAIRSELARWVSKLRRRQLACMPTAAMQLVADRPRSTRSAADHWRAYCCLESMLDALESREAHVIRSRFGLSDECGEQTLQAIADEFGVSRERVRQLERRALKKLFELAQQRQYVPFFDRFLDDCTPTEPAAATMASC